MKDLNYFRRPGTTSPSGRRRLLWASRGKVNAYFEIRGRFVKRSPLRLRENETGRASGGQRATPSGHPFRFAGFTGHEAGEPREANEGPGGSSPWRVKGGALAGAGQRPAGAWGGAPAHLQVLSWPAPGAARHAAPHVAPGFGRVGKACRIGDVDAAFAAQLQKPFARQAVHK